MLISAFELLGIFSIALFIVWILLTIQTGDKINLMLPLIGFGILLTLGTYILGWLFITVGKWMMWQIGLRTVNDIVYVLIYFILLMFCCGRMKRSD